MQWERQRVNALKRVATPRNQIACSEASSNDSKALPCALPNILQAVPALIIRLRLRQVVPQHKSVMLLWLRERRTVGISTRNCAQLGSRPCKGCSSMQLNLKCDTVKHEVGGASFKALQAFPSQFVVADRAMPR
jgi:hypothetical protein